MREKAKNIETAWDIIVIGGGPAGMMAAGRAAEKGAKVLLLEKNDSLGRKLLITGGGRCNLTNAEFDTRKLLAKFNDNNKYLFSAFSKWSVKETLDFFHSRKMETKVEAFQRVFPITDRSESVWNVLVEYMKESGVTVRSKSVVTGFEMVKNKIVAVKLGNKKIEAKQFILATGGKSRPETGSTGDGFKWLKEIGHKVIPSDAALVPIAIEDSWVKRLQGLTLQNTKVSLFQNSVKQSSNTGRILFTHFGLSGPTILNMSRDISELLKYGEVMISLDILQRVIMDNSIQNFRKYLKRTVTKKSKTVWVI